MQDRYTGDIGDFGKLGLLRSLEKHGLRVGVNWYHTPDETHNGDGRHIAYLQKAEFRNCDVEIWNFLGSIVSSGKREIAQLECPDILNARFYGEILDSTSGDKWSRQAVRSQWHEKGINALRGSDIVFVDPDNGLMVPSAEGTSKSNKYVLPYELAEYYHSGASVIYYQHKARRPDDFYLEQHLQLVASGAFPNAGILGLKFTRTSQRFYFFLIHPEHRSSVNCAVAQMMNSTWKNMFSRCL